MHKLLESLFAETDPLKADEILKEIVKDASDNPEVWREELPPAIAEAEKNAEATYEASTDAKRTAWVYMAGNKEDSAKVTDAEVLQAKAAAFDADHVWVKWITISGDLQDLASELARQARRVYVQ